MCQVVGLPFPRSLGTGGSAHTVPSHETPPQTPWHLVSSGSFAWAKQRHLLWKVLPDVSSLTRGAYRAVSTAVRAPIPPHSSTLQPQKTRTCLSPCCILSPWHNCSSVSIPSDAKVHIIFWKSQKDNKSCLCSG